MIADAHAPATKEDIRLLMEQIRRYYDQTESRFSALHLHFDFTVETMRNDFLDTNRDEIEDIKIRVTRLEQSTGSAT